MANKDDIIGRGLVVAICIALIGALVSMRDSSTRQHRTQQAVCAEVLATATASDSLKVYRLQPKCYHEE